MTIWLTAYFEYNGVAATGLTPLVTVTDLSDDSVDINAQAMTEVGSGAYKYDASALDLSKDYSGRVDAGTDSVDDRYQPIDFASFWSKDACDQSFVAYDPPTKTEMDAAFAALNDITVDDIKAGITEGSLDLEGILRVALAILIGITTGGGTTSLTFKNPAGTKVRATETVDENGNRTGIVVDGDDA